MAQSLGKVIVHAVFSTKNREAFLQDRQLREEMHGYLGGALNRLDCLPILIGGTEDHVHLLCVLGRSCSQADMVMEVKRASSKWVKTKSPAMRAFACQNGYAIFSIAQSQIGVAKKYIANQEEHHRKVSFQDELRELLRRYEVPCDERYLWD